MAVSELAIAADEPTIEQLKLENQKLRDELARVKAAQDANAAPAASPAPAVQAPPPATAQAGGDTTVAAKSGAGSANATTLEGVYVSARTRKEKIEDVPIPVTAVNGRTLDLFNAVTVQDYAKLTPNLLVHQPNARQTSISIRGIGKNTANDALEPSVGVIVDGVVSAFIAQSWGDFPDVDHVEILRGPQGTLLGKNTTLGVVQVVTKAPSFKQSTNIEVGAGIVENALNGKLSTTGPIIPGLLAYRASFYGEKRNGPFNDESPDQTDETFQERDRFGGKLQFLLEPTASLTAKLSLDIQESAELLPWGEPPLIGDPTVYPNGVSRTTGTGTTYTSRLARSYFGGYKPLIGNWDLVDNNGSRPTRSNTEGVSAEINWMPRENVTVTSVSAYRQALFDAKNDSDWTHFDIARGGAIIHQNQTSEELRVNTTLNKYADFTAGIYLLDSNVDSTDRTIYGTDAGSFYGSNSQYNTLNPAASSPVGVQLLQDSLRNLFVYTPTHPDTRSAAVFGQNNLHFTDKLTLTLGARFTEENKTNNYSKFIETDSSLLNNIAAGKYVGASTAQINAAKAIRTAQLNALGFAQGENINAPSYAWLVNPSYKLTQDVLLYASASRGEKSGSVQFNTSTLTPQNVKPEKALDYELGTKASLLNHALTLNLNFYDTIITDYQQNVTVTDSTTSTGFRTYLGNVPKVTLRGVEFDGNYSPLQGLSLEAGAAYNKAFYSSFHDAPCSSDISAQVNSAGTAVGPFSCDLTGDQIPYAPKFSGNLGANYRKLITHSLAFNIYGNAVYRGNANYNSALSAQGEQSDYSIFDGGIGILSPQSKWEAYLISTNIGDTKYVTNITSYTSQAASTATPGQRRYAGLVFRAKF